MIFNGTSSGKAYSGLELEAEHIAEENKLLFNHFRETILQAANDTVTKIVLQSPVTEDELSRLAGILRGFGVEAYTAEWTQRRWYGLPFLSMSHTLWQVFHGVTPFYDATGRMQFNLQGGEVPIFSAGKVTVAEERTISTNGRTFGGLSIPVGGGVYYHVGGSQGHKVSGLLPIDVGEMLITSRNIYFGGQKKSLRISLSKIIRYQPYVDAVGIFEAHGAAKVFVPDYSGMETGWFFFNLLSALTNKAD